MLPPPRPLGTRNRFLPPHSPGACFSSHPKRFSHSFPARFHVPSHPAPSIKAVGPWVSQPWFPSLPWGTRAETLTRKEADPPCQRAPACCFLPAACAPPAALPPIPGVPACLSLCTLERGSLPASSVLPHPSPSKPGPWGTSLAFGRGGSTGSPLDSTRVSAAHGLGLPRVGFHL